MKNAFGFVAAAVAVFLAAVPAAAQYSKVEQPWIQQGKISGGISVTGTSAATALPPAGVVAWICNTGSNDAYLTFGTANTVVATVNGSSWLKSGTCGTYDLFPYFNPAPSTFVAAITGGSTTTLTVETGLGSGPRQSSNSGAGGVSPSGTFTAGDLVLGSGAASIQDTLAFGTNGGVSMSGGGTPAFGSCYFNDIQTCTTENVRLRERLFVGNAVLMNDTSATGPNGTFLSSALIGPNWLARGAQTLSMSDVGGIAGAGISHVAGLLGSQSTIGWSSACMNDGASSGVCWGYYDEGQFNPGNTSNSSTYGHETDCKNASSLNATDDPYTKAGGCYGSWLAAGGGGGYGPGVITNGSTTTSQNVINVASVPTFVTAGQSIYDSTTATQIGVVASTGSTTITMVGNALGAVGNGDYLNITYHSNAAYSVVKNLNTWNVGFNIQALSLTADGNGNFAAVNMANQQSLYWYSAASTIADIIRGDATNGLALQGHGSGNDFTVKNSAATVALQIPTGTLNVNIASAGSATAPTLTVGNATTGFHSVSTTGFGIDVNGVTEIDFGIHAGSRVTITPTSESANAAGWLLNSNGASSTVATLIPNQASTTTGMGAQASGNMSAIVGGVEVVRFASTGVLLVGATPTAAASQVGFGNTTTTSASCGTLATSTGCLSINVAGTVRNIPFY